MNRVALTVILAAWSLAARAACTDIAGPQVDWRRCSFDGADLHGENLKGAVLRDASFAFGNLTGSDLSAVEGYRAKFLSATLVDVRFDGALLGEADFTRANLTGASFANADLRRARFFRANLRGADLAGAQMRGADLLGADLSGALWIDGKRRCAEGSVGQCN